MDPLVLFLLTGFVSMSAALSAGTINKLPDADKPPIAQTRNGLVSVVMIGNLGAVGLIFSMAYGLRQLDWWIPVLCLIVTFPVVHIALVQRLLGPARSLFLMLPLVLASLVALYHYW
ncbi:hypothetical protein GCM10011348_26650 [Marinobacterium nitratireducens]|uniref:Uncharacterized protein n=1 Tax=Marinobacterium nitratireducens TaxID=518897 RepID=A0A917ZJR9_9GAMM|nr:hypothetical protein GCM10011348_26650 [Marinobacterium nitratireducens]